MFVVFTSWCSLCCDWYNGGYNVYTIICYMSHSHILRHFPHRYNNMWCKALCVYRFKLWLKVYTQHIKHIVLTFCICKLYLVSLGEHRFSFDHSSFDCTHLSGNPKYFWIKVRWWFRLADESPAYRTHLPATLHFRECPTTDTVDGCTADAAVDAHSSVFHRNCGMD